MMRADDSSALRAFLLFFGYDRPAVVLRFFASPTMNNQTTLADLQSEKDLLERDAAAFRQSLHELHQGGREHTLPAHVWQAEFARQHEKLVVVTGKIGGLDKRILAFVEGVPTCHQST